MGETEQRETMEKDFDIIIKEARQAGKLDARRGLQLLVTRLTTLLGYYVWVPLGEEALAAWQVRIPRTDLPDDSWLGEEAAELVHFCAPVDALMAIEGRDREKSAEHFGYVRDEDNTLTDTASFKCMMCDRKMPVELAKKGKAQISLHQIAQQV